MQCAIEVLECSCRHNEFEFTLISSVQRSEGIGYEILFGALTNVVMVNASTHVVGLHISSFVCSE